MVKKIWNNICEYPWISGVIGIGLLFILVIFITYGVSLGPRSHDHTAWSSFGSMLAGVFTLFGTTATIATLLFLNAQFKEQQKVTAKQIQAVTFEQYVNHRKLFFERLKEIEESLDVKIKFKNHDNLYHNIFPQNSPRQCLFTVEIVSGELEKVGDLSDMHSSYILLKGILEKSQWLPIEADDLVRHLIMMPNALSFLNVGDEYDGDMELEGYNFGINIYSINEYVIRVTTILNAFLTFTGNSPVPSIDHHAESSELRKALMQNFDGRYAAKHGLVPIKKIKMIDELARLHFWIDQAKDIAGQRMFLEAWQKLNILFSSKLKVNELKDSRAYKDMIQRFLDELHLVKDKVSLNSYEFTVVDEYFTKLKEIERGLNN
ncbi:MULTISPECIES: hypothetical protein [Pseudomonas]|uniref:hypothetical protein n=1 Tax=Pseudomonas TaxID=286 RepID=UPI0015A22B4D|nr:MULTISPECIES: hypothetical protein [Pseudomonas]NWC39696.1 hypothetical protein [Pseudomonas tolaasii]NWF17392.1 hypothetical protein [Pseudomonas reactans]